MTISRRQFLTAAGAAGALAASGALNRLTGVLASPGPAAADASTLPLPADSGIEHIVVVCMENRSFDHYLGWVPRANGMQAGLSYQDDQGHWHSTHHLADWSGCGFNDPDHSYEGGRTQLDPNGTMTGFRKGDNDDFALGYYTREDLPFHSAVVDNFTICDNYFCSILGPTYPNRFYTHAAQTDRITNSMTQSTVPTIWDYTLPGAGQKMTGTYYFSDLPFLALWGPTYAPISRHVEHFFADAAAGTLSQYSYLDPFFLGEGQGGSNDDHPHADIRRGQNFLGRVVNALMTSPLWSKTILVVTYDEWGGFFEHVKPPTLPDAFPATAAEEHNTAGFRVPCYVISPFASANAINSVQFDHTSILKMAEWRFGLPALTPRDAAANNLALTLDFSQRNPASADQLPVVTDPGPHYCQNDNAIGAEWLLDKTPAGNAVMGNADPFWYEFSRSPLLAGWRNVD
jgi:phospholipase C